MAKKLDPQEIEQSRRKKTRADNREERKERIHDGIRKNRESGGVIIIPPPPAVQAQGQAPRKMRVAAYVRVSTQEEQQVGSFEMQIVYFKSKIESNPDWELVKIYQDYGVSGTSTNKRQGFKDMIDDAKAGKIDLILTKGINRFGRNTVDILNNLRTLNALTPPVPVRFESEGLSSIGDGSNNLLIAVLSALAELESQQKSEAIKNGIRWRMAEGIYQFSVINTLGYYWDHFGRLLIEPTEAKIVEYIYESCLEGATPAEIAAALTEQGIKSPKGKDFWRAATIRGILRNEKYCGDALMQKTCTIDFQEHKSVKNTMLNKYFKEEHHTAIIKKSDWQKVQQILDEKPLPGKSARLHAMPKRFTVTRSKDKYFRGYIILDPRWTASERREMLKEMKTH